MTNLKDEQAAPTEPSKSPVVEEQKSEVIHTSDQIFTKSTKEIAERQQKKQREKDLKRLRKLEEDSAKKIRDFFRVIIQRKKAKTAPLQLIQVDDNEGPFGLTKSPTVANLLTKVVTDIVQLNSNQPQNIVAAPDSKDTQKPFVSKIHKDTLNLDAKELVLDDFFKNHDDNPIDYNVIRDKQVLDTDELPRKASIDIDEDFMLVK